MPMLSYIRKACDRANVAFVIAFLDEQLLLLARRRGGVDGVWEAESETLVNSDQYDMIFCSQPTIKVLFCFFSLARSSYRL